MSDPAATADSEPLMPAPERVLADQREARLYAWGTREYGELLALQQRLHAARKGDAIADTWLAGEHPLVITQGVRGAQGDLLEAAGYQVGCTGKGWGPGNWRISGRPRNPAGTEINSARLKPPYQSVSANDYAANNPHNTPSLRVTNAPTNVVTVPGGLIYVTEVYTRYNLLTPVPNIGLPIPQQLYSIAYF